MYCNYVAKLLDFAIIDVQGFKSNSDKFIVKEISCVTKNLTFNDIITEPYEFKNLNAASQEQAQWLTHNQHGIKWEEGNLTLEELHEEFLPIIRYKTIYVKGAEKVEWVRDILNYDPRNTLSIIDVESHGCKLELNGENRNSENCSCSKHSNMIRTYNCTLQNVLKIKKWFMEYKKIYYDDDGDD